MVWDGNGWIALVDDDSNPQPPPPKSNSWKRPDTSLFVGVSSFRDKRCPQTLVNYFTKAKFPERLTVGVVQQNEHEDVDCVAAYCKLMGNKKEDSTCPYFDNIKIVRVEAKNAAGPCYGRHLQVGICGWGGGGGGGVTSSRCCLSRGNGGNVLVVVVGGEDAGGILILILILTS